MAAGRDRAASSSDLVQDLISQVSATSQEPSLLLSSDTINAFNNILQQLRHLLVDSASSSRAKDTFRRARGFEFLLQALSIFSGALSENFSSTSFRSEQFEALKNCLLVVSDALCDHPTNRLHFSSSTGINGWSLTETALSYITVLTSSTNLPIEAIHELQLLFGLLFAVSIGDDAFIQTFQHTNPFHDDSTDLPSAKQAPLLGDSIFKSTDFVRNSEIIPVIYRLWLKLYLESKQSLASEAEPASQRTGIQSLSAKILFALGSLVKSSEFNTVAVHGSNLLRPVLETLFSSKLPFRESSILESLALELLGLGMNNLDDAAYFFEVAEDNSTVSEKLLAAIKVSRKPAHFFFDMSMHGFASLEFAELPKAFPPSDPSLGYTLTAWVYIHTFDNACHITLFGAFDESQSCFVLVYLESNTHHLVLQTSISSPNPSTRFKSVTFEKHRWYHIALLHHRARNTRPSRASLFVNGRFVEQRKCQYPDQPQGLRRQPSGNNVIVQGFFGTPRDLSPRLGGGVLSAKWALAGAHLFHEALSEELILVFFQMGPAYYGNFQDCLGSFQTYKASTQLNLLNEEKNGPGAENSRLANAVKLKAGQLNPESNLCISVSPAMVLKDRDPKSLEITTSKTKNVLEERFNAASNDLVINLSVPLLAKAIAKPFGFGSVTGGTVNFKPLALEDCCWRLSGCLTTGLKLIAQASTPSNLFTATEILLQMIRENWRNSEAMERDNGFGILSWILQTKLCYDFSAPNLIKPLESVRNADTADQHSIENLFCLILRFLGLDLDSPNKSLVNNPLAYRQLVVDCHVWERASNRIQILYFNQFIILTSQSQFKDFNARRLNRMRKWFPMY